ncbi:MAG TPA: acyl-ACP--UDP-N-acetylglucosamine O-acyltransferase [Rickettsiales bacterium]|nr:acyl-ACP--UDP-N-acetylglucosamine O-acyltransferase [Rickettsiales bacterium]
MTNIHPTAVIEDGAKLAPDVKVGAFCVVGAEATLSSGVELVSHVSVSGCTEIGQNTKIFPFASIGHAPQDLKYKGEKSRLVIGKNNMIREHVTMNPGTQGGGMLTQVGDNCLFMVGAHVAHDCRVGNNVILANNATLGGHVTVDDFAIIGGLAAVHQFVRIGRHAIVGGMSGVENDVIPYGSVIGERASLAGLNLVGLKRRNFDRETIHALRTAYKMLFDADKGTLFERSTQVQETFQKFAPVQEIISFMEDKGTRSLCTPKMS